MDNHDITVIQVNKNLELHLGYIGGTTTGFDEADPIYTADKPFIALKSEIPTKTSDLQNDSGFISNIPQNLVTEQELNNKGYLTSFTQSDPVYSKDKPILALKSELFSKSYNDLTDKPDLYTPVSDGDGSKFLADDGTYKTVLTDFEVDLSNYVTQGNINFTTTDANGNLTNKFSQQAGYTQIGCAYTNLVELFGNYLKWYQQNNQGYPFYGVDFSQATEFKLPENTTVNGNKFSFNILRDLTFEDEKTQDDGVFYADFTGSVVQRYSTLNVISNGILNFGINANEYISNTCPTIQLMIPYNTTDLSTFTFPDNFQQIKIPQKITYDNTYTYNYAVFVVRRINDVYFINYSYSYGQN